MKTCNECEQQKPLQFFYKSPRAKDGHHSKCKICYSERYDKTYYSANKEKVKERRRIAFVDQVTWYRGFKASPCMDCQEKYHPVCMQFDHRPGVEKIENVSSMIRRGYSREDVEDEIAKCDLVCANCHALRTWQRASVESQQALLETTPS